MLDHFVIAEILRREREEAFVQEELVLEMPSDKEPQPPTVEPKSNRGVCIIEML